MSAVARNLAVVRKAIAEIKDLEDDLMSKNEEHRSVFRQKVEWMATVARNAVREVSEAVDQLKTIQKDVDKYLKGLKDGVD